MADQGTRRERVQVELDPEAYSSLERIAEGKPNDEVVGAALKLVATLKDLQQQGHEVGVETRQLRRIQCSLL
jgi:hypothetical protein